MMDDPKRQFQPPIDIFYSFPPHWKDFIVSLVTLLLRINQGCQDRQRTQVNLEGQTDRPIGY